MLGSIFLILVLLLISISLIVWGISVCITSSQSNGSVSNGIEFFAWTIGNGAEIFTQVPTAVWPYTRSGNTAFITYSAKINQQTPADPNLPIIVTLPLLASSLIGGIPLYSFSLPSGETGIEVVQFSAGSIAFRYLPSGNYATGADLAISTWNIVFWVSLVIA